MKDEDTECRICGKPCYSYPCRYCAYNGEELEKPINRQLTAKEIYETSEVFDPNILIDNEEIFDVPANKLDKIVSEGVKQSNKIYKTQYPFSAPKISSILHDAKYRSIIDGEQLAKLLQKFGIDDN